MTIVMIDDDDNDNNEMTTIVKFVVSNETIFPKH